MINIISARAQIVFYPDFFGEIAAAAGGKICF